MIMDILIYIQMNLKLNDYDEFYFEGYGYEKRKDDQNGNTLNYCHKK